MVSNNGRLVSKSLNGRLVSWCLTGVWFHGLLPSFTGVWFHGLLPSFTVFSFQHLGGRLFSRTSPFNTRTAVGFHGLFLSSFRGRVAQASGQGWTGWVGRGAGGATAGSQRRGDPRRVRSDQATHVLEAAIIRGSDCATHGGSAATR